MKRIALALLCLVLSAGFARAQNRKVFPYKTHVKELPNGLKLVAVPFDSPGIIAYYIVVRTGSRNEIEPGVTGFAHFFEHMMFRGTPKYSTARYQEIIKELGADSNAFTSDDWTCYHATLPASALETITDMESDRFQNLKYSVEDFQKEAKAVLGEYNKNASSPFLILNEVMRDTAFASHTYKHSTIGFLKDVIDMPNQYEYSLKFFDRFYRPEYCTVVVAGDVKPERFFALSEKYYGPWKRGSYVAPIPSEPTQAEERTADAEWKGPALPITTVSYKSPAFSLVEKDAAALNLLGQLAFSETSALYQKLILEEKRADLFGGGAQDRRDPSLFTIFVRAKDKNDLSAIREAIYAEIEKFKTKPVSPDELAEVKSNFRYKLVMSLRTPDSVAVTLGNFINLSGDTDAINKVAALYDSITPEDLQRVAQKVFTKENRTVVTLKGGAK